MRQRFDRLGAVTVAALAVAWAAVPTAYADSSVEPGQVSITVSADAQDLTAGQHVTYAIDVHNEATQDLPQATVIQMLPPALDFTSATPSAHTEGREVVWTFDLPTDGSASLTMTGTAGTATQAVAQADIRTGAPSARAAAPGASDRTAVATTVCVRESAVGQILSCATSHTGLAEPVPAWWKQNLTWYMAGGALLAVGAVVSPFTWRRRTRTR